MLNRQRGRKFPLVIALAVTLSLLLAPFGHAVSHDLAVPGAASETFQDASSATAASHNHSHSHSHSHSHDDGWPEEKHGPASHGHPAADHLHEVPAPVDFPAPVLAWCGGAPSIFPADFPLQGPSFAIERPPQA